MNNPPNNPLSPTPFAPADEITSLNINDLDVAALQARLEMAVAMVEVCVSHKSCSCGSLASCGSYCS